MEDRQITYTLAIDIPVNRETSKMYSPSDEITEYSVRYCMNHVKHVIKKEGFITLERVFRILDLRANPECPHILLTEVSDWTFKNELLSIFFCHDFELLPVVRKRPNLREILADEAAKNEDDEEEEEEDWPSLSQKETSGSGESGETSSDSSRKS